jgi:hypothetical protein
VIRGTSVIEVLSLTSDRVQPVASRDTFSALWCLKTLRPPGEKRDLLVVGSDSGWVTLIEVGLPLVRHGCCYLGSNKPDGDWCCTDDQAFL